MSLLLVEKEKHALTLFLYAAMSVRDSYHVESINARRLAIKTSVNYAQRMQNRNVDVVKTQRLCHATQSITQKSLEMKL